MAEEFFERLRTYYLKVADVLRGEAESGSIFPNSTDVGQARERIYEQFLRLHVPTKCNVFCGGFVFGSDGTESKQMDVIVTADAVPRYAFHNHAGAGKEFSPVDGTLAAVSIKSTLNKNELEDALDGLASIPAVCAANCLVSPLLANVDKTFPDWPYKIVYANNGISMETLMEHLNNYYISNPTVPTGRRPNLIHVSGKYAVLRAEKGMLATEGSSGKTVAVNVGSYCPVVVDADLHAIVWALENIQKRAIIATNVLYVYADHLNRVLRKPTHEEQAAAAELLEGEPPLSGLTT